MYIYDSIDCFFLTNLLKGPAILPPVEDDPYQKTPRSFGDANNRPHPASYRNEIRPGSKGSSITTHKPMNIYRAAFNDNMIHRTAEKKSANTYLSGAKDWS